MHFIFYWRIYGVLISLLLFQARIFYTSIDCTLISTDENRTHQKNELFFYYQYILIEDKYSFYVKDEMSINGHGALQPT